MIIQFLQLKPRLTADEIIERMNREERKRLLTVQHVMWRDLPRRNQMKWAAAACLMAAVVLAVILWVRL